MNDSGNPAKVVNRVTLVAGAAANPKKKQPAADSKVDCVDDLPRLLKATLRMGLRHSHRPVPTQYCIWLVGLQWRTVMASLLKTTPRRIAYRPWAVRRWRSSCNSATVLAQAEGFLDALANAHSRAVGWRDGQDHAIRQNT